MSSDGAGEAVGVDNNDAGPEDDEREGGANPGDRSVAESAEVDAAAKISPRKAKGKVETTASPTQMKKAPGSAGGSAAAAAAPSGETVHLASDSSKPPEAAPSHQPDVAESLPEGASAEAYAQKLADVSMTLSAREEKLLRLTQENDEHQETHAILRSQVEQLELQLQDDQTSHLENLTEEFTERLGETESKLKDALRDRETARSKLAELTERYAADVDESGEQLTALEAEKDEKIAALTKEAQKLADSSFKSSQINKKLQKKVKEADEVTKKLNTRIDEGQSTINKLQGQLSEKADAEKMHKKSASQVTAVSEQQSKQLSSLKAKVKDLTDKNGGLQAALDTAHKNNEGLQQDAAEAKAKASNAVQSAEVGAQESLKLELQRMEAETARVQEGLSSQVADLQAVLRRSEAQGARREDNLRKEIADLNDRLRLAEEREQQMTESLSQTTKPLVRQIDMLRQALQSQTSNHELAESTLSNRLQDAQAALVEAEGAEQIATERFSEMRLKFAAMEEKHGKLRREHLDVRTEADLLRSKLEEAETALKDQHSAAVATQAAHTESKEKWVRKLSEVEATATDRLVVADGKTADVQKLLDAAIKERDTALSASSLSESMAMPPTDSREVGSISSSSGRGRSSLGGVGSSNTASASGSNVSSRPTSPSGGPGVSMADKLHSTAQQNERDVTTLQSQLAALEASRASIADELVDLVRKNDELSQLSNQVPILHAAKTDAEKKLDQVLQMYGEKAEQCTELEMDLQDVKAMFREETLRLLDRVEQLEGATT